MAGRFANTRTANNATDRTPVGTPVSGSLSIIFSASWAVRRTWRRTGIRKIRTNTVITAMTVTLVVNTVASVGLMIISLLFRLFFLP